MRIALWNAATLRLAELAHGVQRREVAESVPAPHPFAVVGETVHRGFEIGRDERAQAVVVEADEPAQEPDGEQVLAPRLLLEDDLGEHRSA